MNPALRNIATHKKAINWLLVLAFLSLTLFPYHYHLHHTDDPTEIGAATHVHVVEPHLHVGIEDAGDHDGNHTIESSSGITLKTSGPQLPLFAMLFVLSLLLPFNRREEHQLSAPVNQELPPHNPGITPPLRAPPHR